MKTYTHDDWLRISRNMEQQGGHFAQTLGKLMIVADSYNRVRIAAAFPDYLESYDFSPWVSPTIGEDPK